MVKRPGRRRPRHRPGKLHTDKTYDNRRVRRYLRRRGITVRIARIGVDSSECFGRHSWVVERTIVWLLAFHRPIRGHDRNGVTIAAVATLAITVICARRLLRKNY